MNIRDDVLMWKESKLQCVSVRVSEYVSVPVSVSVSVPVSMSEGTESLSPPSENLSESETQVNHLHSSRSESESNHRNSELQTDLVSTLANKSLLHERAGC